MKSEPVVPRRGFLRHDIDWRDDDEGDDREPGDDECDLCMTSGLAIYRVTLDGRRVCGHCEGEADRIDAEIKEEGE